MPDSWIDKEEVDELFRAFASPLGASDEPKDSPPEGESEEDDVPSDIVEKAAVESDESEEIDSDEDLPDRGFAITTIEEIEDYIAAESRSSEEQNELDEQLPAEADEKIEEAATAEEFEEVTDPEPEPVVETKQDEAEVEVVVEEEDQEELVAEEAIAEDWVSSITVLEEEDEDPDEEDPADLVLVEQSEEPKFEETTVSAVDKARHFSFFASDTAEEVSEPEGSEADAVKAVQALAQAREIAKEGGLLRSEQEKEDGVVTVMIPQSDDSAEEEENQFVDELKCEDQFLDIASIPLPQNSPGFTMEETIAQRLEKFANLFKERVGATNISITDGDGLPLYSGSDAEETSSPFRLVFYMRDIAMSMGMEERVSSFVSVGEGNWLCLLYSSSSADDQPVVQAIVPKPLSTAQLCHWERLLERAVRPGAVDLQVAG